VNAVRNLIQLAIEDRSDIVGEPIAIFAWIKKVPIGCREISVLPPDRTILGRS
jgi:hypothetical protein